MTITARYPGRCPACRQPISVGTPVEWSKGSPARHVTCPAAVAPLRIPAFSAATGTDYGSGQWLQSAAPQQPRQPRCFECGTRDGIEFISGAGSYLCARHVDTY